MNFLSPLPISQRIFPAFSYSSARRGMYTKLALTLIRKHCILRRGTRAPAHTRSLAIALQNIFLAHKRSYLVTTVHGCTLAASAQETAYKASVHSPPASAAINDAIFTHCIHKNCRMKSQWKACICTVATQACQIIHTYIRLYCCAVGWQLQPIAKKWPAQVQSEQSTCVLKYAQLKCCSYNARTTSAGESSCI